MPVYVMLTSLTDEGRKTVRDNPERIKEVNKEVEGMGVKIISQHVVMGPISAASLVAKRGFPWTVA